MVGMAASPRCSRLTTAGSSSMVSAWRWRARSTPSRAGPAGQELAVLDELLQQGPVVAVVLRAVADADDLLGGRAALVELAQRVLAPALAGLVLGGLGHGDEVAVVVRAADQLVDHARRGRAGTGHERRADAVGVHRGGLQGGDGELVQVGGDHDPVSARCPGRPAAGGPTAPAPRGRRSPAGRRPACRPASSTAVRTAASTSYVSTSSEVPAPIEAICASKASRSVSCRRVKECAAVPTVLSP